MQSEKKRYEYSVSEICTSCRINGVHFSPDRSIRAGLEMEIEERQTQTAVYNPNNPQMSFII